MSISSRKRSRSRRRDLAGSGSRFGPQRLAELRHPAAAAGACRVGRGRARIAGLIGTLLGSGLTSDSSLTNHPESAAAQDLIDARLPGQDAVDEVIVVRSERSVVSDPAFGAHVRGMVGRLRRSGGVAQISSYLGPGRRDPGLGGPARDGAAGRPRRAEGGPDRGAHRARRARATAAAASRRTSPAATRSIATSPSSRASDLSKGELRFGLPAALIVLLLVVGTLVGAAIPMMMAIISIIVALGITAVVGQAFELNLFIVNMVVAMGLALGIDYSLFIVSPAARGATSRRGYA